MQELLIEHQDALQSERLIEYGSTLGLDIDRFRTDLEERRYAMRVARDIESGDASGVAGTPTFFINGRRHEGPPDVASLTAAIESARTAMRAATLQNPGQRPGRGRDQLGAGILRRS